MLEHICQDKKIVLALVLSHQFQEMIRERKLEDYAGWVSACVTSGIMELKTLHKDCSEIRQQFKQRFSIREVTVRSKGN